jgi:excisionase family DNA binding protein
MTHPPAGPSTPPPPPGPKADHPRTIAEAAAEIGIGYHKLRKLVAGNAVPFKRFGRSVRFYDADIAAVKAQFQVTPSAAVVPISRGRRVA